MAQSTSFTSRKCFFVPVLERVSALLSAASAAWLQELVDPFARPSGRLEGFPSDVCVLSFRQKSAPTSEQAVVRVAWGSGAGRRDSSLLDVAEQH